jgi:competence protein ComEA
MNSANKQLLNWFGYTRKERRSSFILLVILIIVISARYLFQSGERDIEIENLAALTVSDDTLQAGLSDNEIDTAALFRFNPNRISSDSLMLLGLSETQARTIINYRNKGGRFRYVSDLKKIYGIDEKTAEAIIPYIIIETEKVNTRNYRSAFQDQQKSFKKLDLNKCDSAALVRLAGIGPVLSARIIKFRRLLGGFATAEQLKEVYGLPETTYNYLAGRVFADSSDVTGIKINDTGFNELSRHPYLTRYEIESIIKYKQLKGRFSNIAELIDNKILSPEKARKLSPYLKF